MSTIKQLNERIAKLETELNKLRPQRLPQAGDVYIGTLGGTDEWNVIIVECDCGMGFFHNDGSGFVCESPHDLKRKLDEGRYEYSGRCDKITVKDSE